MNEIVNYPIKEAQSEPVINIAGRDYVVMPYESYCAIPANAVGTYARHGEDGLSRMLSQYVRTVQEDIQNRLLDAEAFTVVEEPSDDPQARYFRILAPVLIPADTAEKWRDSSEENLHRIEVEAVERRKTGKPYTFKVVERKDPAD